MNTQEIRDFLTYNIHTRRIFREVLARDQLKNIRVPKFKPSAYVINSDPINKPGQHWTAVVFNGQGSAEYFDSYGLPPNHNQIHEFITKNAQRVYFNQRTLQDITSIKCGLFVLYFIHKKSKGTPLSQLLRPFKSHNLLINDRVVTSYIRRYFFHPMKIYQHKRS